MIIDEKDYLAHYGILRRSGRYPWGSGENPYQRSTSFMGMVSDLRKEGLSNTEIARGFGMTTTEFRAATSLARSTVKQADISTAVRLRERGWSKVAIGERMGINESSVRALLAESEKDKVNVLETTANMLKEQVDKKGYIDIGTGVERSLPGAPGTDQRIGISKNKLDTAVARLREEGYKIHYVNVEQVATGKRTKMKVLGGPDSEWKDVINNPHKIKQINEYSDDGGRTYLGIEPPISIDSKRIRVRYAEDGGKEADGVLYIRPGVDDLDLGKSNYAQVRVAVDGTHYMKGMAIYKTDLPDGVDVVYNTTKSKDEAKSKLDVMKPLKSDTDNPFGAVIARQSGVMNILREEGDWADWSKTLSSQVLSKQSPTLAKTQLEMTHERRRNELDEIKNLTNPAVRRKLLESFSDDADSAAVHLKAAALPRQSNSVLLPVKSMKANEIYAPNYRNGERVVLIRHPHGGVFEIPELTVNNRQPEAKALLGSARDSVGINSKVAERLSGADFDGDTVLVIPNNQGKVKTAPALAGLKDFDPQNAYPAYEGMPEMTPATKQNQMGQVSNLITDMTIQGAPGSELARAVRHSMVVIDAEKHHLNYKQSAIDNGIPQLKKKYQGQGGKGLGASTLISRASAEKRVPLRKARPASEGGPIDKKTGKKVYVETGESWIDSKGKLHVKKMKSTQLAETDDAHTLSSGTPMEKVYANHSNRLKGLANEARRELVNTKSIPYSPSAKAAYSNEVAALNSKLNIALMNAPRERQANIVANAVVAKKRQADPTLEPSEVKKLRAQALAEARTRTGAKKDRIDITPSEWDAIQAGAITNHKLTQILNNSDLDQIKKLATPKSRPVMTPIKAARARAMANSGYTQAEIADALGVSISTISEAIN